MRTSQIITITVFLLTLSFLKPNLALANNLPIEAETKPPEPITLEIEANNLEAKELNNLIKDEEYKVLQIEGEIQVGTEKVTDNLIKVKGENLAELDKEITEQRELLLLNLKNTEELGKENKPKKDKEKKIKDLEKSLTENRQIKKNIQKIKATYETEEKANKTIEKQVFKNNKKIKKIEKKQVKMEEKAQEIQDKLPETKKDKVKKNLDKLKTSLLNNLTQQLKPMQEVYAAGTGWIPNYVDIAFYDTDELGVWPLEWWKDTSNATTYQRPYATNLWWRTYIIHQGTDGYPYLGKFRDEGAKDFEGWRKLDFPYVLEDRDHSIASQTNWLWHATRSTKTNKIYIRRSSDGGNTWTVFKDLGIKSSTAIDMINQGGNNLCIVYKGDVNQNVYVGCSNDWTVNNESWRWKQVPNIATSMQPSIASSFGSLWVAHRGNDRRVYVQSSYDNGNTWNAVANVRGGTTDSPIGLAGIGKAEWKNERLCVIIRGTTDKGMINHSCLYRYWDNYNNEKWNYHPWMKQQGLTNDGPVVVSDTSRMIQVHRTLDNKIQTRALQWANPGGRGYVSNMMWKQPYFIENPNEKWDFYLNPYQPNRLKEVVTGRGETYEHEVYLYKYGISEKDNIDYNSGKKLYISDDTEWWPNCMPKKVRYWSSNLPGAYLDTRANFTQCDSFGGEPSYTIGSDRASLIKANQYYFTYWHGDKGELYRPIFKVQGALGARKPYNEYGTWKSFGYVKDPSATQTLIDFSTNIKFNTDEGISKRFEDYPYWYKKYTR